MQKFIVALVLGGILIGAVYASAATLGITGVNSIGSNESEVTGSGTITDVTFGLDTDISIASTAVVTLPASGSGTDILDFLILSGSCSGTTEFTINTTGASGSRTINLDSNGGGTGPNLTSAGLAVSQIDCVKFTVQQGN